MKQWENKDKISMIIRCSDCCRPKIGNEAKESRGKKRMTRISELSEHQSHHRSICQSTINKHYRSVS
ncbi:hypothetical protein AB6A40_004074 [Gnathostoma spinigerum]|uniref:Uncharacterized protein n=1 Tax=Gnathostoma spinigerum TaxID=75299 RepID=A0ABD6ECJ7_9BILA